MYVKTVQAYIPQMQANETICRHIVMKYGNGERQLYGKLNLKNFIEFRKCLKNEEAKLTLTNSLIEMNLPIDSK